ncbi:MAG: hypothetical protein FJ288_03115 [Planctomycetes bacterium]|nr:hypothetical protein [Planctomycetota bacterium]
MSLLRKGILVSGGQVLAVALNMVAGILFARTLGPDGMGQIELLRYVATVTVTVVAMGLGPAIVYFLNNRRVPVTAIVSNSAWVISVLGPIVATGMTAAILLMPHYFGAVPAAVAVVFSLGTAAVLAMGLWRQTLVAQLAANRMVAVDLTPPATTLAVGSALAVAGLLSPGGALVAGAVGSMASAGLLLRFLWPHVDLARPFDWRLLWQLLKYGVQLAAGNVLNVLSMSVTVVLLRYLVLERFEEVGLYTRAVAICGLVTLVPVAIAPLLYARWSGLGGEARTRQVEMALRLNVGYGVVTAAGIILFGRYVIWLLYGAKFIPAEAALVFLAPALFFTPITGVCTNLLNSDGRARTTACILAGTVVIVSAVTCLAVPAMGIRGAALATLCGNGFAGAAGMAVCVRLYGVKLQRCFLLLPQDVSYIVHSLRPRQP